MKSTNEKALEICLDYSKSAETQFNELQDLGLDLEDIFKISLKAGDFDQKET